MRAGADRKEGYGQPLSAECPLPLPRSEGQGGPADQICLIAVPDITCGGCVARIERQLSSCPGVIAVRANLTQRQVRVTLENGATSVGPILNALDALGYTGRELASDDAPEMAPAKTDRYLLKCIAVAGFGLMNVMLLSVSVWSGASDTTRSVFHLVSAIIALPVIAYSGQPFFRSSLGALRKRQLNMDVPISLAVLLALGLSLFETAAGGAHVFFDAALMLLFFLLTGRYLDQLMRNRARSAVSGLGRLMPHGAFVQMSNGDFEWTQLSDLEPGMRLRIEPGERIPVDARLEQGKSDLDRSLVTGEAEPVAVHPGADLESGTLNLTGKIEVVVVRPASRSFLAEMIGMLSAAEGGRAAYVRIADRAARLYAPLVHLLALSTFMGWMWVGGDWQNAAFTAISVLIITCPCALGLAVPVVHVIAAGRLMREGILMKDGSALERLANIDMAVFDKTGTLTTGVPAVLSSPNGETDRSAAKGLALRSRHPAAQAIAAYLTEAAIDVTGIEEVPGYGVQGWIDGRCARLGRKSWVGEIARGAEVKTGPAFAFEDAYSIAFELTETLRPGALRTVEALRNEGISLSILSGDDERAVSRIADRLGIDEAGHGWTPAQKVARLKELAGKGHHALMVGDGLNDTAALAAAHVSMAPSTASDAGKTAADFIFLRDSLEAVSVAYRVAKATAGLVRQNFGLAIAYNCVAVPIAVLGMVTPLIAALAMSVSSILVIGNSLRLNRLSFSTRYRSATLQSGAAPA